MTKHYKYKTKPFEHQRQALIQGAEKRNFAYFMEMGTGKTKVAIDNACWLYQQNKICTVIVIAPNSVYRNWIKEIKTHSPVSDLNICAHKVDSFRYKDGHLNWFLINVEALSHTSGVRVLQEITQNYFSSCMMILDESTTIKNRTAKRSKNICKLGKPIQYKRILTGSPITKSPLDLFTQCAFLSESLLGFKSFFTFRARYAVMQQIEMNGRAVLFPKYYTNLNELEEKLKTFSYRVRKHECLDLPEKLYQVRQLNMSIEQNEVYQQLRRNAFAILQDKEVSFANKLTEIIKLHQVCNGYVKSDDGTVTPFDNCAKLKDLMTIIEEGEGKFIIWANYVHNIKTIIQALQKSYGNDSVVAIYGEVSTEDRTEAVERFQNDDSCRFFVGNPSTGGYGLTLTNASYVIYFSNSYNLEVRQQSEDRAHRIGQKKNVTYIDLIMRDTIDQLIIGSLKRKIKISAETLGEEVLKWL